MKPAPACPRCREAGRPVPRTTLEHLLEPARATSLPPQGSWRFCATPSCPVVWYPDDPAGPVFTTAEVRVPVGLKEGSGPPRTVCYCFDHTVEEIEEDLRARGRTDVVEEITRRVQAGECDCEARNPEGRCCLGRVRAEVQAARERLGISPSPPSGRGSAPGPVWLAAGAAGAALLASACCWIPLLLAGLGLGAGGLAVGLEGARPWLAGLVVVLIGAAWVLAGRRPQGADAAACCDPAGPSWRRRVRRRRLAILALGLLAVGAWFLPGRLALQGSSSAASGAAGPAGRQTPSCCDLESEPDPAPRGAPPAAETEAGLRTSVFQVQGLQKTATGAT